MSPRAVAQGGLSTPATQGARGARIFANRRLAAHVTTALIVANARYWPTVAAPVHGELSRWGRLAGSIPDLSLRACASDKLRSERFNAEVAATLATLAPRACRRDALEAMVALQVAYDYLDVLGEHGPAEEAAGARPATPELFELFLDPIASVPAWWDGEWDGGYLQELRRALSAALSRLPSYSTVREVAQGAAARCAQAQLLNHSVPHEGTAELERWASEGALSSSLHWQEYLAGAEASVLAIHALIAAAAAEGTTREQAIELDSLYQSIGAFTMLDSLVDRNEDLAEGASGFVEYYGGDLDLLADRLEDVMRDVICAARSLPNGPHHIMTLVGVVAYYGSAPGAGSELAKPVFARLEAQLRPVLGTALALMRAWRLAKRVRA